ncbi:pentatricopeptide repeat (PPR) superfamily protein isoform X2 [Tasmannia lanceolata]|uniref:pentatricopeptide repeat (PPR) superfamily protein isoform X2 n=1 Tax=Tasmannia lanceolata TaxID=3420 RepID=UPI004063565D
MQREEEREIHPPGHENQSVHVCPKCGWSFPNSHPSSKHRSAHNKICGKIEGFKVMNLEVSDDELSDEDHSPGASKYQHLGLDENGSGGIEAEVGGNQSEEEVFSDAVSEFADTKSDPIINTVVDKDLRMISKNWAGDRALEGLAGSNTPKTTDLISSDQIRNPDALESEPVQMHCGFHDHTLSATSDAVSSFILHKRTETLAVDPTEDTNNCACFLLPGASPVTPATPNTEANTCKNVIDGSVAVAEGHEKSSEDKNLPAIALRCIPASDCSQIDSKLGQQKPQNGLSLSIHMGPMVAEDHDYPGALVHAAQAPEGSPPIDSTLEANIQIPSDADEGCHVHVHGYGDENMPTFSDTTVGNISDMKSELSLQEHDPIICHGQVRTETLLHEKPQNDLTSSTCLGSTQVGEDNDQVDRSDSDCMHKELIVDQSGTDGDRHEERAQYIELIPSECAVDGLGLEESDAHSIVTNGEPLVAKVITQVNEDLGRDEAERNLQLTKSTLLDTDIGLKGGNINTSHLENVSEPNSDQSSQEIAFHSSLSEYYLEKPILNQSSEDRLYQFDAQNPTPKDHVTSAVDAGCVQSSVTLKNCNTQGFAEGDASDNHSHSLQEEGGDILKQNANATVLDTDISVDSTSQIDSVEGYWGSSSDGAVPSISNATDSQTILATEPLPGINVQTSTEASNANIKKENTAGEHRTDNTDLFEAPSFMTLVEPGRLNNRQPNSADIQNPQRPNSPSFQAAWFPSITHVVNESQGRKKNEEIIAKVVNWSSGQPYTPLRNLMVEANHERKQKLPIAPDHITTTTHKDQAYQDDGLPTKMAPEFSAPLDIKGVEKEWNSPARLPESKTGKMKVRGKPYWVSFVCCSSVN